MIVKCVLSYPTESAREVSRLLLEGHRWPDGMILRGPFHFRFLGEGLRALHVFEIDDEQAGPCLAAIRLYPRRFIGVKGLSYIVDVGLELDELCDLVGVR